MTRQEFELGPLWEGVPKSKGFRIAIPNPLELTYWAKTTSQSMGDITENDLLQRQYSQTEKYIDGVSNLLSVGERIWQFEINDDLFSNIELELSAGYSVEYGSSSELVFLLNHSDEALKKGNDWDYSKKSNEISEYLNKKGILNAVNQNDDKSWEISVAEKNEESNINIFLGFKDQEDLKSSNWDYDRISAIQIRINDLSLSTIDCLKNIQNIQIAASHTVDSLYLVSGKQPPDIIFEISKETELQ